MTAQRVIPGRSKGCDHRPARLEQFTHRPENCWGVIEVFECIHGDDDIRALCGLRRERAAIIYTSLRGMCTRHPQPAFLNVNSDDFARAPLSHFNTHLTRPASEVNHYLIFDVTPKVRAEQRFKPALICVSAAVRRVFLITFVD